MAVYVKLGMDEYWLSTYICVNMIEYPLNKFGNG